MYPINSVTPAILAAHGLSLSNSANLTLLNSQIGSAAAKTAGFSLPFSNFPPTTTVTNALRPYPAVRKHDGELLGRQLLVRLACR